MLEYMHIYIVVAIYFNNITTFFQILSGGPFEEQLNAYKNKSFCCYRKFQLILRNIRGLRSNVCTATTFQSMDYRRSNILAAKQSSVSISTFNVTFNVNSSRKYACICICIYIYPILIRKYYNEKFLQFHTITNCTEWKFLRKNVLSGGHYPWRS